MFFGSEVWQVSKECVQMYVCVCLRIVNHTEVRVIQTELGTPSQNVAGTHKDCYFSHTLTDRAF